MRRPRGLPYGADGRRRRSPSTTPPATSPTSRPATSTPTPPAASTTTRPPSLAPHPRLGHSRRRPPRRPAARCSSAKACPTPSPPPKPASTRSDCSAPTHPRRNRRRPTRQPRHKPRVTRLAIVCDPDPAGRHLADALTPLLAEGGQVTGRDHTTRRARPQRLGSCRSELDTPIAAIPRPHTSRTLDRHRGRPVNRTAADTPAN